ncbi:YfhE family protein [Bacillus tianshenii]|nr:YfhE family protein [Bacillus tianshenii]
MEKNKIPYKGINTDKNNGLSSAQEVHYPKEFKKAYKAEERERGK